MKNNQIAIMLVGVLLMTTLVNAWLSFSYVSSLHKIRLMQPQINKVTFDRNVLQQLVGEMAEYSKKNPDMERLLRSMGPNNGQAAPVAAPKAPGIAAPGGAPATKPTK